MLPVHVQLDYWMNGEHRDAINFWDRHRDFTNNLMECFNRIFNGENGKRQTIHQFMDAMQIIFGLSVLTHHQMELCKDESNDYEYAALFNKVKLIQKKANKELKQHRDWFPSLENPTFDQQKQYVLNIHKIRGHRWDKIVRHGVCEEDQLIDEIEGSINAPPESEEKTNCVLQLYPDLGRIHKEINAENVLDDVCSVSLCDKYYGYLREPDQLKKFGNKATFKASAISNFVVVPQIQISGNFAMSIMAIKPKKNKTAYPALLICVQRPWFLYFRPLAPKNMKRYDVVKIEDFHFYVIKRS